MIVEVDSKELKQIEKRIAALEAIIRRLVQALEKK